MSEEKKLKEIAVESLDSELAAAKKMEENKNTVYGKVAAVFAFSMSLFHILTVFRHKDREVDLGHLPDLLFETQLAEGLLDKFFNFGVTPDGRVRRCRTSCKDGKCCHCKEGFAVFHIEFQFYVVNYARQR